MDARQVIEAYYEAFNRKDWDAMLALMADDVAHDINQGGREIGKKAFATFLAMMDEHYDERLTDVVVMTSACGTRAAAEFTCAGTYRKAPESLPTARGQRYSLPVGAFFEIASGKIRRVTNFYNIRNWTRQVQ